MRQQDRAPDTVSYFMRDCSCSRALPDAIHQSLYLNILVDSIHTRFRVIQLIYHICCYLHISWLPCVSTQSTLTGVYRCVMNLKSISVTDRYIPKFTSLFIKTSREISARTTSFRPVGHRMRECVSATIHYMASRSMNAWAIDSSTQFFA
ncbi:hypothetical protein M404DRAFT_623901 [Pisolithus tinctorius Marx 270]|uniref:Uncharacterized protein n=1 Tax=Pisolithus tinctorius Marx 270 TaxID=870435 RepID=A0A0C3NRM2_PISTI|nr:hypothetical protein M404DRAFT_623901 [Pisolithus tinctorius Marx 270]